MLTNREAVCQFGPWSTSAGGVFTPGGSAVGGGVVGNYLQDLAYKALLPGDTGTAWWSSAPAVWPIHPDELMVEFGCSALPTPPTFAGLSAYQLHNANVQLWLSDAIPSSAANLVAIGRRFSVVGPGQTVRLTLKPDQQFVSLLAWSEYTIVGTNAAIVSLSGYIARVTASLVSVT